MNQQIVGRYFEESGISYVVPDNKRLSQDLLIPPQDKNNAKQGQYVVAEIVHQPDKHRQAIGKVISIIGDGLDASMAVYIAIHSYDLEFEWYEELG